MTCHWQTVPKYGHRRCFDSIFPTALATLSMTSQALASGMTFAQHTDREEDMVSGGKHEAYSDVATTADAIRGTFVEHQEELTWLAGFLTGDDVLAEACVADACASAQRLSVDLLPMTPEFATFHSAVQMQRSRVAELCEIYEARECAPRSHERLLPESLEFLVTESDVIRARLDALCRFVLVLCGIEKCSAAQAAQWLGVNECAVEAAYDAALDSLEVFYCESQIGLHPSTATWN